MTNICLSDLLLRAVQLHGSRTAVACEGRATSYAELDALSSKLAGFLSGRGVGQGDVVAIHLPNRVEFLVADLAILKLRAVKVPLSDMMSAEEVEHCLEHSGARCLISCREPAPTASLLRGGLLEVRVGDPVGSVVHWDDALRADPCAPRRRSSPEDPAVLVYTGGTTGRPKGILHRDGPLGQCLLSHVVNGEIAPDEVMLLTTPLPHSAGWFAQAGLFQGARLELARRFDAADFIARAAAGVTWTFAVPTMLYRLLERIGDGPTPTSIRTVIYGAAPMDPARLEGLRRVFGDVFVQLYGQSECPNFITRLTKDDHADPRLLRSCGRPVSFAEVRLGSGEETAPGEVGEVAVRCPYVMDGYLDPEPGVGNPITDGWLRTGDLGYTDEEGYLFLVDRAKDMIITGGMNVYCAEVENALRQEPSVRDAAVIGMPDADWGERVVGVVVGEADPALLIAALRGRLATYKVPKEVCVVESLPTTRFGKIDKKQLRSMLRNGSPS